MQDFFSYYIRQQTILADVTVGCQSNGRRVSSISDLLAPAAKAAPAGPPTPASRGRLCCRTGRTAPPYFIASQAIPLLTHTPCYSAATAASHRSRTSEPSYSSPRGHPLPRLPRLHVVPVLGFAVVHRPGALGAAWSTWSTTDFHRKSTVRGEADSWVQAAARKCLLITHKIIIPPPDSRDPPDGPPYFAKNVSPLTAGTHWMGHLIS